MDTALFLYMLSFVGLYEASVCPSKEDIYPCKCGFVAVYNAASNIRIDCDNIRNPEQLAAPMTTIERSKTEVSYLYIKNSSLLYLPGNIFRNTHIKEVLFRYSEIMSLSDSDTAFSGLEEVLTEISAVDIKFASHWDFNQLRNLKALRKIFLHTMFLRAVDHPFPHLPELTQMNIISSEISYVTDDAFSNIPKLVDFNMKNNKITEMKRSMFSNPVNNLYNIDLSKNRLSYLPDDFFENMPKLNNVYLDQNKFITLSQRPFSEAFRKISTLYMSDAFSFFLLFCLFGALKAVVCSFKEDIRPCKCLYRNRIMEIECSNLVNAGQLNSPMRAIERSKFKVQSLRITNSSLLYLPDDLFRNTHIEKVYFINTEIMSLSEFGKAFSGLEEVLAVFRILARQGKFASPGNFEQFRYLKKLKHLIYTGIHVDAVDSPIPHFPELIELYMYKTKISYITDDAFINLPKLTYFIFSENEITEMKRSMFSNPASYLSLISLDDNLLSSLPNDFFDNMPVLSRVNLKKNKFITLSERPFLAVFRNVKELLISDNPFRCDCRMNWLVKVRFPAIFDGKCNTQIFVWKKYKYAGL